VVNGFDLVEQGPLVRQSIGIVFQDSTLDDYLTAEQNLRYHCMIYRVPRTAYRVESGSVGWATCSSSWG
jgi:ABC-2 type transport system ATP-binding protein